MIRVWQSESDPETLLIQYDEDTIYVLREGWTSPVDTAPLDEGWEEMVPSRFLLELADKWDLDAKDNSRNRSSSSRHGRELRSVVESEHHSRVTEDDD